MLSYDNLKTRSAKKVSKTLDVPIMVFDYFELSEMMIAMACILIFQLLIGSIFLNFISLIIVLGVVPVIRRSNEKGVFLHWPYRKFNMSLPGLINPRGNKRYSD